MFWGNVGGGLSGPIGNLSDMSIKNGVAGQNITIAMINASNDLPLTGATMSGFITKDFGTQAPTGGTFTELTPTGRGIYNYAITQVETVANCIGFLATATGGVPVHVMFLTTGLHRGVSGQSIMYGLYTTAGAADAGATPTVQISKDGGPLVAGTGTTTNLNNGQYRYAITNPAEINVTNSVVFVISATGDVTLCIEVFVVP